MSEVLRVVVSLAPVFAFLVALSLLDSFRLLPLPRVLRAILTGAVVAGGCLLVATLVRERSLVDAGTYSRYIAPLLEELGKAVPVIIAVRRRRVGFMVDAAILGFAVGAGFAAAENVYYLLNLTSSNVLLWLARGLGTAVMHGGTTAIVGIVSQALAMRLRREAPVVFLPGLAIAVVAHATFNHFVLPPLVSASILVVGFSLLVVVVFERSERLLRNWLEVGFSTDVELLEMLRSGEIRETRVGAYLRSLTDRFPGEILADMLCYLLVMVELSIKAKVVLLARQAGLGLPKDSEIGERLAELRYLEDHIGPMGKLALAPFLHVSSRELWQLTMLESNAGGRS